MKSRLRKLSGELELVAEPEMLAKAGDFSIEK